MEAQEPTTSVTVDVGGTPPEPPYARAALTWNKAAVAAAAAEARRWQEHTLNEEKHYCYCGGDRTYTELTLQCDGCRNWFHGKCIRCPLGPVVPFISNYTFKCAWCGKGKESMARTTAGWRGIISTAIANLTVKSKFKEKWHNKKDGVVPYIDKHWGAVCTGRARTATWWSTVGTCLATDTGELFACLDTPRSAGSKFTLADPNLFNITPNSLPAVTSAPRAPRAPKAAPDGDGSTAIPRKRREDRDGEGATSARDRTRGGNRDSAPPPKRRARTDVVERDVLKKTTGLPVEHPVNRDGFRYMMAERNPLFADDVYRERYLSPDAVLMSREDRSPLINLGRDFLTLSTDKGFRLARATHGAVAGTWFFEVEIKDARQLTAAQRDDPQHDGAHVRLGWSRRSATLEAPVGSDKFGYGYRSKTGDKLFNSQPTPYGASFGAGDVIGLLIDLPESPVDRRSALPASLSRAVTLPKAPNGRIAIAYKGHAFFEEKEAFETETPPVLAGSRIEFFKNGQSQGAAFADIPQGEYYPSVSLYNGATVTVNFGATPFKHAPAPAAGPWRPFAARFTDKVAEDTLLELAHELLYGESEVAPTAASALVPTVAPAAGLGPEQPRPPAATPANTIAATMMDADPAAADEDDGADGEGSDDADGDGDVDAEGDGDGDEDEDEEGVEDVHADAD